LSRESWDSPLRKFTTATGFTSFPYGKLPKGHNKKNRLSHRLSRRYPLEPETNSMIVRSIIALHTPFIKTADRIPLPNLFLHYTRFIHR
jgi:hypothetical protein